MEKLTTKKLKKKSVRELTAIADQMATRMQWLHSTGKDKTDPDQFKRLGLEIYHLSELIDEKILKKSNKKYNNYE